MLNKPDEVLPSDLTVCCLLIVGGRIMPPPPPPAKDVHVLIPIPVTVLPCKAERDFEG